MGTFVPGSWAQPEAHGLDWRTCSNLLKPFPSQKEGGASNPLFKVTLEKENKIVNLLCSLLSFSANICPVSTEVIATEFLYRRSSGLPAQFARHADPLFLLKIIIGV